jgi:hypothetical protein
MCGTLVYEDKDFQFYTIFASVQKFRAVSFKFHETFVLQQNCIN